MNRRFYLFLILLLALVPVESVAQRLQQQLGRGVVVVNRNGTNRTGDGGNGALVSWRKLAQEPEGTTYNLYRRAAGSDSYTKVNTTPLTKTNYSLASSALKTNTEYAVTAIVNGVEGEMSHPFLYQTRKWDNVWFDFDFDNTVIKRDDYRTKFVWPMDLDGNGEFDAVVVDRLFSGAADNDDAENQSDNTATTSHKIQAYKFDGTLLWTVDMGPNVNISGGQNDMVVAYDINCDGKCEVIIRSSDGTRFWDKANETWGLYAMGSSVADVDGDGIVDYRSQTKRNRPFYVSVIDGATGAEIACSELDYSQVHDGSDSYTRNNRSDYMSDGYAAMDGHFSICYTDGIHPALVMECLDRDNNKTHHNYVFTWEFDWVGGTASNWHQSATWSRNDKRPWPAEFHQLRVADVNGDGCDEMIQGGYSLNTRTGWFSSPGIGHGDRYIVSDIDPDRPGLEVFAIQQSALLGQLLYDPATGERIKEWYLPSVYDVGRGACMDIDPAHKGYEIYSFTDDYLYNCHGDATGETRSQWGISTMFEGFWWNGDLLREELSSPGGSGWTTNMMVTTVRGKSRLIEFSRESDWGTMGATGTRPAFMGDITGDWREEVILVKQNNDHSTGLTGYATNIPTNYSIYCLQQDPHYRGDCTTRGYYQHPNTSFYLGADMPLPPLPPVLQADCRYVSGAWSAGAAGFSSYDQKQSVAYADGQSVMFDLSGNNDSPIEITGDVQPSATYFMNPRGKDYELNGNIGGTGVIIKSQLGTTTLTGDLRTTGTTIISEGTLAVNGTIEGPVELRAKGTLGGFAVLKGALTIEGALNYEGCRLQPGRQPYPTGMKVEDMGVMELTQDFDLNQQLYIDAHISMYYDDRTERAGNIGRADRVKVDGNLNIASKGQIVFNILCNDDQPMPGEYTLVQFASFTGEASNIAVRGLVGLNYDVEVREQAIVLVIRGTREAGSIVWTGATDGNWDYKTDNFALADVATPFVANDEVLFNDDATQRTIQLDELMVTNGVRFAHNSGRYTLNGDGGLSGTGTLTMNGTGSLFLNCTKSDYTGTTIINNGIVTVKNLENAGTPSSLGAGSEIQIAKGTLTIDNTNAATDRKVTLTDSAAINVPKGSASFKSAVTGTGVLIKKGAGQINFTYGGNNSFAGLELQAGTIAQGAWNATIGKSGAPISVTGNAAINVFNNNSTSAVPSLNNAITVSKGKTLTIGTGQRCKVQGKLAGEGTVKISFPYVRGDFETNCSAFEGTLNPTSGQFRLSSTFNLQNGTFTPGAGVYVAHVKSQSGTEESRTAKIGALSSTATDCSFGTGTWNVGYLGTNTTFAGSFNASGTLHKYGEGVLTLTGASAANITIHEGSISADNTAAPVTSGSITVYKDAALYGAGQAASVTIQQGGMLCAGKPTSSSVATLTLTGNLTARAGAIFRVRGRGTTNRCDAFQVAGKVTLNNPVFQMERLAGDWQPDTDYKVFTGEGQITLTGEPTFQPAVPAAGYLWDYSSLASDGVIRIVVDPTVGINGISADDGSRRIIHDAAGRRVNQTNRHGIYIINGQKVVK